MCRAAVCVELLCARQCVEDLGVLSWPDVTYGVLMQWCLWVLSQLSANCELMHRHMQPRRTMGHKDHAMLSPTTMNPGTLHVAALCQNQQCRSTMICCAQLPTWQKNLQWNCHTALAMTTCQYCLRNSTKIYRRLPWRYRSANHKYTIAGHYSTSTFPQPAVVAERVCAWFEASIPAAWSLSWSCDTTLSAASPLTDTVQLGLCGRCSLSVCNVCKTSFFTSSSHGGYISFCCSLIQHGNKSWHPGWARPCSQEIEPKVSTW